MKSKRTSDEKYKILLAISVIILSGIGLMLLNITKLGSYTDDSIIMLRHLKSGSTLKLEVAVSDAKHEEGLMFRDSLAKDTGMLFIFNYPQILTFWMKNTSIPLDIIYLDNDMNVVSYYNSTEPNQTKVVYPSNTDARYVIETFSGWALQHSLAIGDKFSIQ